jgi:hypothetical protein
MPPDEVEGLSKKHLEEVWVCVVSHAFALHVRKWDGQEMRKGHLFHSEFNDADGDTALFGHCPEVLRMDNCNSLRDLCLML